MDTIRLITKDLLIGGLSPNLRGASCKRILKRWWCVTAVLVIGGLITPVDYAHALDALGRIPQGQRPGEDRLPVPDFEEPESRPELVLPPVRPPMPADPLSAQQRVFVRGFVFEGNQVFSDEELATITAPYENRVITSGELQELRDKLTIYYIRRGYINSGVVIPDQQVVEGIIALRIVEGVLTDIEISGNERLRSSYVEDRLRLDAGPPLNINDLQLRFQLLQQNPLIERINGELIPGVISGEAELGVSLEEANPFKFSAEINNHRPPSVDAEQLVLEGRHINLTGRGDTLLTSVGITGGLNDYYAAYTLPITSRDTRLSVDFEYIDSDVEEDPFDAIDIESKSRTFGLRINHPLRRTLSSELSLGLALELRHSKTYLLGEPFSFSPGVKDGESNITALRFQQYWYHRSRKQVLAARSVFSVGLDALGATDNHGGLPDGEFFAWLGQFQWARRLGDGDYQVIFRADAQLARDSLLPIEQFVVGGADTVRGYRENQFVRDSGVVGSLEFRIPVLRTEAGRTWLWLAPFADYGRAWNEDLPTPDIRDIYSAGLGLLWDPVPQIHGEVYWGHAFRSIDNGDVSHDLQDDGVHFLLRYDLF